MGTASDDPQDERDLAAVVLAAGHGRRMGVPKALLAIDGTTLVERHVARLVELGCAPVLVVVRPETAGTVRPRVEHFGLVVRVVTARTSSQAESLIAGASVLVPPGSPHAIRETIVTPVDMLPASLATLDTLLAALVRPLLAVTPTHRGRGGHPIVIGAELLVRLVRTGAEAPEGSQLPSLRDVLDGLGPRRARVAVEDAKVLGDFDVPSDLPRSFEPLHEPG